MIFIPVKAFEIDEITTVYYNSQYQSCYVRSDVDYSDQEWFIGIIGFIGEIENYESYLIWIRENQSKVDAARKLPHWSL